MMKSVTYSFSVSIFFRRLKFDQQWTCGILGLFEQDVANRYLSEEIIPLQDVAGVQGAKQQNYSDKKLEQKCGTTKHMQQIAATADNHQNASFDSNTQCHTATDMFNDMHGTSTELVENETNYTGDKPMILEHFRVSQVCT